LIKNPANFLLAPLAEILPLSCPLTEQDIPDNSRAMHQGFFYYKSGIYLAKYLNSELLTQVMKS
jgi:hypothetical protein